MNMQPNYRRGEHLDITTQPWVSAPVSVAPLKKLIARLPSQAVLREKLSMALATRADEDGGLVIRCASDTSNLAVSIAETLRQMSNRTIRIELDFLQRASEYDEKIEGVSIQELRNTSIYDLGQADRTPYLLVLTATWRTVVVQRAGPIPGLPNGISLAGLHFVLNQLGINTTE